MADIQTHLPKFFDGQTVGAQTIDLIIPYNCGTQRMGTIELTVYIADTVSGNFGIGRIVVPFLRGGGASVNLGTPVPVIPLQTPGTLAGASITGVVSNNTTIIGRFTGVAGRTIMIGAKVQIETIQR